MTSDVTPPKDPQAGDSSPTDDHPQPEESPEPSAEERRRRPSTSVVVSLVIAGALFVLAFSPVSRLAAHGLPRAPGSLAPVVTGTQHGTTTAVQAVPAGLPNGARIRTAADVFPYAVAALGKPDALALMALLNSKTYLANSLAGYSTGTVKYPYTYPPLNAVLDQAPTASFASGGIALGAALTVLAAQPQSNNFQTFAGAISNAAPAAYGVLNRARAAGGCAPQLDLLLLLTADQVTLLNADQSTSWGVLGQEEQRAETACPHDPTPGWLVGQSQLRMVVFSESATDAETNVVAALRAANTTFSHLAAEYPRDAGVLTGLADSYLRAGTYLRSSEPFTARQDFRSAIAAYNRASALGDERDAAPGVARADRPRRAGHSGASAGALGSVERLPGTAPGVAHRGR